jgi:arylsulfatase A-like enzyme
MKQKDIVRLWRENIINIFFSVFALIGMEWLFIITKPSFLSFSSLNEKLAVLPMSVIFLTAALVILSAPLALIAVAANKNKKISALLISIIPAFIFACLGLLLIDNFTYTLFKIGIVSSSGVGRVSYLLGFVFLFGLFLRTIQTHTHKILSREWQPKSRWIPIVFTTFTIILSGLIVLPFVFDSSYFSTNSLTNNNEGSLPNIILLTPDGVNASNMSVYGYERQTTPFLDSMKDKLVVSDNHFTNSGNTSGSITSLLTSKLPTTTRVLFPPDLLRGTDTIEHLPAILREHGYYVAQFGVEHYVDATVLNFQNGFNEVNGATIESKGLAYRINQKFPSDSKLFLQEVESRLADRLGQIFFIKDMENTYTQITQTQINFGDKEKIEQTVNLLKQQEEPVFVHVHWMGTHGSKFYPAVTKFSEGIDRATQEPWDNNLYDDAIVDFDDAVKDLYNSLKQINEADKTLIIIASDHGQRWTTDNRIPLLILIPNTLPIKKPQKTTQNIDIAPTILDLLNIPKPRWMQGFSLFENQEMNSQILIATFGKSKVVEGVWSIDTKYSNPPFYQFDTVALINCDKFYQLHLQEDGYFWNQSYVPSYTGLCQDRDYLSLTLVRETIIEQLNRDGFKFDESQIPEIP